MSSDPYNTAWMTMSDEEEIDAHKRSSRAILVDGDVGSGRHHVSETGVNGTHHGSANGGRPGKYVVIGPPKGAPGSAPPLASRVRARWRCLVGFVVVLGVCQVFVLAIVVHLGLQVAKTRAALDAARGAGAAGNDAVVGTGKGSASFGVPGGATYIRWGRTSCDAPSIRVYEGYTGSSYYSHQGGGVDFLCLPSKPQFGRDTNETKSGAFMVGTEYQNAYLHHVFDSSNAQSEQGAVKDLVDHDMPCAVCMAPAASTTIMIPGRNECLGDESWKNEYSGFLMSSHYTEHTSSFICVDGAPEVVPEGGLNHNGATLFLVSVHCGSLPCPPYEQGRELTCAVCSRRR